MIKPAIICGLLGLAVSTLLILVILNLCRQTQFWRRTRDIHHTHRGPIPRFGGLAIASAFVVLELFLHFAYPEQQGLSGFGNVTVLASLAMFGLGFWDDLKPLGAKRKFAGQILIAFAVWWFGIGISEFRIPGTGYVVYFKSWSALVTVFWLVGMANLINLIDGIDGLAGGICLMLMTLLGYMGLESGNFGLLCTGMAGAIVGFLLFNFPPARIYLGDGGAYFLGFQIGIIALVNSHKGTVAAALIAPLFVLALPILDTTLAILRRGLRGLPIFRPDRRHLHHRLLRSGLSRRRVVLLFYAVTLIFMLFGLAAFWSDARLVPVLLGACIMILLICAGAFQFSREWFAVGRIVGNSLEIRRQVQYAVALTRWLVMEGSRHSSIAGLWEDFVFAARKLGFTAVRLTMAQGQKAWEDPEAAGPTRVVRHDLPGAGILEFAAPAPPETQPVGGPNGHHSPVASVTDSNLFEITAELLAESWGKAVAEMSVRHGNRVVFDSADETKLAPVSKSSGDVVVAVPE